MRDTDEIALGAAGELDVKGNIPDPLPALRMLLAGLGFHPNAGWT
jgi:hypothetical protein